jgi:hypothetical protein
MRFQSLRITAQSLGKIELGRPPSRLTLFGGAGVVCGFVDPGSSMDKKESFDSVSAFH